MTNWTASDIPPQNGRTIVITGTGGLGYQDALALSRADASVIIAGRNAEKGAEALANIRRSVPTAQVRFERLDLADLASVAAFGERLRDEEEAVDVLINNAGVMTPPRRKVTKDGFELQFGTNYLGHFALTAQLLPLLRRGKDARVVSVSSTANRTGQIDFDDLQAEKSYKAMRVYAQSKLANLLFAFELQRRSEQSDWGLTSVAAHPGLSRTDLLPNGTGRASMTSIVMRHLLGHVVLQPAAQGALPTLYAATSPEAKAGAYYGPDKRRETRGHPTLAQVPPQAIEQEVARRLWKISEELCEVTFSDVDLGVAR